MADINRGQYYAEKLTIAASSEAEAERIIRARHPGRIVTAQEGTDQYGRNYYDVAVWWDAADAEGDDGRRAIARYAIPREGEHDPAERIVSAN